MTFVHGPWGRRTKDFSIEGHLHQYKFAIQSAKPTVFVYQELRGQEKDDPELDRIRLEIKEKLIEKNLAVYSTINRAARSLSGFIGYYENRK